MIRVYNRHVVPDAQDKIILIYKENKLYYRGRYWEMSFSKGVRFKIDLIDKEKMNCTLSGEKDYQHQLEQWFQAQANEIIYSVIQRVCPILGKWPKKIVLKQQKTRWGSCGINDTIQINWRLIFAPEGILEYVVVHELSHLLHRNHGLSFWKTVTKFFPEQAEARKWLRKEGDPLMGMKIEASFCLQESFRSLGEPL